jgi:predicted GIY-YIG superfamily endonuclease
MAIVYQHKRLDTNEVFYVGIGKNINRAYSKHSRSKIWKDTIKNRKYSIEILFENLTWEEACIKEKELISKYGRKDLGTGSLINLTEGGEGVANPSEEVRRKNGEAHKGLIAWNRGLTKETDVRIAEASKKMKQYVKTEEHCKNLKKAQNTPEIIEAKRLRALGDKNPAKRPEVKEKIKKSQKGNKYRVGTKHTEETKKLLSEKKMGKGLGFSNPKATPVQQLDIITGEVLRTYSCAVEAKNITGIDNSNIAGCCNGRINTAGGYKWRKITKEEYLNILNK